MLEKITYINHINESIEFGSNGIYVNENDLHDFDWTTNSDNNKISSFSRGIVTKTIPLIIKCDSVSEGLAIKNRLFEIAEKDVLTTTHGKLVIGDYYLKCFFRGSKKSDYLIHKGYMQVKVTVTTDYSSWIKESTVVFRPTVSTDGTGVATASEINYEKRNFDFNYDFPFDYTSEMLNKTLNNTGFVDSAFKLIVYGSCINPIIYIGGHAYEVDVEIGEDEHLTIDSMTKKITLTKYNGEEVNCFQYRNRESYIFQKIPTGQNIVTWDGDYGFDVVLYEERSEPKWT